MKRVLRGAIVLFLSVVATTAHGLTFTGGGPGDGPDETLSASATFVVSNFYLVITLSNTAASDPDNSADILTGIFFTLNGDPSLVRDSALLGPDTTMKNLPGENVAGMNVGEKWTYRNDLTGLPLGANEGISSTGLGKFNRHFLFPGPNLPGPTSLGNIQYGITTDFDTTGNDK